jgi:hypothetical protein
VRGIDDAVAALDLGELAGSRPKSAGDSSNVRILPSSSAATLVCRCGDLVEAIAMTTQTLSNRDRALLRRSAPPLRREDAQQLAAHAGRIGERAEQIEDGARAEFDTRWGRRGAWRNDVLGEHEADAGFANAAGDDLGVTSSLTPSAARLSAAPDLS